MIPAPVAVSPPDAAVCADGDAVDEAFAGAAPVSSDPPVAAKEAGAPKLKPG
jgi:hypothetical protein